MEVEYSDTIVVWISVLNVVVNGIEVSVEGSNVVPYLLEYKTWSYNPKASTIRKKNLVLYLTRVL